MSIVRAIVGTASTVALAEAILEGDWPQALGWYTALMTTVAWSLDR